MTDFVIYILKSGMALGVLYLLYFVLFRKETFHHLNRIYILGAMVISLVVPSLHIQLSQPVSHVENNFEYVNYAFLDLSETMEYVKTTTTEQVESYPVIVWFLLVGMVISMIRVGFQLFSIYKNINKYEIKTQGKYNYVLIDQHYSTHSFFNYIFVQKSEFKKKRMKEVLLHEQIHADQLHSVDLLLFGFLSVLQWFNPFIYLFKRALVETHEFQADQAVIRLGIDKSQYQRLLLEHARSVVIAGLTSSFNQSIIKNRLKMMNKIKSGNSVIIKYLMVFPVVFFIGIVFAISQGRIEDSIVEVINVSQASDSVVGSSDFAIIEVPMDDQAEFKADKIYTKNGNDIYLEGHVSIKSKNNNYNVNADNVVYRESERKLYAFTDDYVPSIMPVKEEDVKITSGFGMRMHPILKEKRMHNGIDFSAKMGTEIVATANGTIRSAKSDGAYGNRVIIDHGNGFSTSYNQMQKWIVEPGQSVKKGEVIGYVGNTGLSTGPHLHYEIMKDGAYVDPADYLGKSE
jgi:murein DD-endopeptidase MepM/ murein hydrolase activator NlpD